MRGTGAPSTINALRAIFASLGLPARLVTDNSPPFLSRDFKEFCDKNLIQISPYRPQTNDVAKNARKTIKKAIKRARYEGDGGDAALSIFL